MLALGIPSENIVVHGVSQGAALTLYISVHTKYKLGGFLPIVGWLPLRKVEPVYNIQPVPININTPMLHITGTLDPLVPNYPCGTTTRDDMQQVFENYQHKAMTGTHALMFNPLLLHESKKWIQQNINIGV